MKDSVIQNKILKDHVSKNDFSHAYLFYGKNDDDKFFQAKEFYKEIIKGEIDAQEQEKIYYQIDKNIFPELYIIDSEKEEIKKEEIIKLKKIFETKPLFTKSRVYIIKDCDLLNKHSANSLLKFLEEPEKNIIAILITNNINALLPTIISRTTLISFDYDKKNEGLIIDKILNSFSEKEALEKKEKVYELIENIISNPISVFNNSDKVVKDLISDRNEYKTMLKLFLYFFFEVINYKTLTEKPEYNDTIKVIGDYLNIEEVIEKELFLSEELEKNRFNVNLNLAFDNLVIELGGKKLWK